MKRSMKRVYGAGCVLALAAGLAPCGPAAYAAPAAAGDARAAAGEALPAEEEPAAQSWPSTWR